MAKNYIARKQSGWTVVSLVPDVCKTPIGSSTPPVPYPVTAKLEKANKPAKSVNINGKPAVLFNKSYVPKTLGDAPGKAKGIKSNTVGGKCHPKDHSKTVRIEGHPILRHGDLFWMNG